MNTNKYFRGAKVKKVVARKPDDKMRVRYVPPWVCGDKHHRDVELGTVEKIEGETAFVKFETRPGFGNALQRVSVWDLLVEEAA